MREHLMTRMIVGHGIIYSIDVVGPSIDMSFVSGSAAILIIPIRLHQLLRLNPSRDRDRLRTPSTTVVFVSFPFSS